MKKGRCTYCGELVNVKETDIIGTCDKCNKTYSVKNTLEFFEIPDELASDIKQLRSNMMAQFEANGTAEGQSREVKDIIPNDFVTSYIFAASKSKSEYFINKFFLDVDKTYATPGEIEYVINDVIRKLKLEDKYKVIDFIKKMAETPVELMQWRDLLDEKIHKLETGYDSADVIKVIYSKDDIQSYKKVKEALEISGYEVGADNSLFTLAITSENCIDDAHFEQKIMDNKDDIFIEFKTSIFTHNVFMNQYFGINDYVLVKDNFDDSLVELITTTNEVTRCIKNGYSNRISDIKAKLKKSNEQYIAKIEEKKRQEDLKRQAEEKKRLEKEALKRLEEEKAREEALRLARLEAERVAKEKEEAERLDRMEQLIFESYNSSKNIKQVYQETNEIEKQIDKIEKLISCDEILIALDSVLNLVEKYPKDYRVHFLYARLESDNFKNVMNSTHIKHMEKALSLATTEQKQEMLEEYIPYTALREKALVLNQLAYQLKTRVKNVPISVKYCNEGIKCYKNKDYVNAVENWKKASELNNIEACYCLAVQYISGKFVQQNLTKAMILLIKAAKSNHEKSIQTLADAYERGLFGLEKDSEAACHYYRLLVERGNKDIFPTIRVLAEEYFKKSIEEKASYKAIALQFYEMLADNGDVEAMLKAANIHAYGIGQAYDRSKTIHYYKKAAALKNETGMVKYAEIVKKGLYESKKDIDKYVELVCELADQHRDNVEYQKQYIELYEFGLYGVTKSDKMVVKIYEDLARLIPNEEYYQLKLAEIYENGLYNVAIDCRRALNLYQNVVNLNPLNEVAQCKLADVFEFGLYGVKKDMSRVGKIYGFLANKYPKNTTYLNKLAELFMMSSGKNAFEIGIKYYKKSFELGDFTAGANLVINYYLGDYSRQNKNYAEVLKYAEKLFNSYDVMDLSMAEERLYFKALEVLIRVCYNGGYGVTENEEKAKELLVSYNEKSKTKLKLKELAD